MDEIPEQEDWEINIRSDMWLTMGISQLSIQQELVLDKLAKLATMAQSPTIRDLECALKMALDDLNNLINRNEEIKKQQRRITM